MVSRKGFHGDVAAFLFLATLASAAHRGDAGAPPTRYNDRRSPSGGARGGPLKVLTIGDWGEALLLAQDRVAAGMAQWAEENNPDYILSTGDNIYPAGINSPDDNQMVRKWYDAYNYTSLAGLDWYVSLGNHDYGNWVDGVEWNQVEFSKLEPRWILPHLWYDWIDDMGDFTVHWVVIDSEAFDKLIVRNNYTEMITWMDATLRDSAADWKIVVGHRHVFAVGDVVQRGGPVTSSIYNILVPIMERWGATAYVCGHDHNLQHIRRISDTGLDYVLSGGGGALISRYVKANEDFIREHYEVEPLFFQFTYGFVTMELTKEAIRYDYFDPGAQLVYSFTREKNASADAKKRAAADAAAAAG